jgi:hypothetical protein
MTNCGFLNVSYAHLFMQRVKARVRARQFEKEICRRNTNASGEADPVIVTSVA